MSPLLIIGGAIGILVLVATFCLGRMTAFDQMARGDRR